MGGFMVKLPVFDVLGRAFSAPFKFTWPLLPFYIVAAAVAIGLVAGSFQFGSAVMAPGSEELNVDWQQGLGMFAVFLVAYLIFVSTAVLAHRVAADVEHRWNLVWPVIRYVLVALLLGLTGILFFGLGFVVIGAITGANMGSEVEAAELNPGAVIAMILFVLLGIALGARLFLSLPAAALQKKRAIRLAWRVSRGNTLRLFAAWILYFILIIAINAASFLVVGGSEVLMQNPDMEAGGMLGAVGAGWLIVNVVVNYYATVAGATFLTYSLIALMPNDVAAIEPASGVANAQAQ